MKDAKELKLMTTDDAVAQIQDNMILGIGTGSTIELLIPKIAERIQQDHLNVTGVCTSNKSEFLAKQYNINVVDINDITYIDLAIDGADEIDSDLNLIKGGGGALFREKVIHEFLIHLTGVLETGYFLDMTTQAIIGTQEGIKVINKK